MSRRAFVFPLVTVLALAPTASRAMPERVAQEPSARVEHHLREIAPIVQHFETVLASECPRFATGEEWRAWLDDEVERVVLLVAHVEQAWVEAKLSPDDDTRRVAKMPRRHLDRAQSLLDKLQACADENGARFAPGSLWRRVEREAPRRQAEIALPR